LRPSGCKISHKRALILELFGQIGYKKLSFIV
jgi:hypothetical protein